MKVFLSENNVDYGTYTFNYALYAIKESNAELDELYGRGFLPYTGNTTLQREIFYLARSLRVDIAQFEDTSENRRICRQIAELNIGLEVVEKSKFDLTDNTFNTFCHNYINERIGDDNMSIERWNYILKQSTGTHLLVFKNTDQVFGYVLAAISADSVQYWFSFFDTTFMRSHSLGKYMMWAVIDWAKRNAKKHVYLGTAYKPAALYKIRDHKGLEFFDGSNWSNDIKMLKEMCQTDLEPKAADRFKLMENPNQYLNNLMS